MLIKKPKQVQLAILCIWASLPLLFLYCIFEYFTQRSDADSLEQIISLIVSMFSIIVYAWLALKIASRRNWARWVFAIICILGMLSLLGFAFLEDSFSNMGPVEKASLAIQCALNVTALLLLFAPSSNDWFGTKHANGEL